MTKSGFLLLKTTSGTFPLGARGETLDTRREQEKETTEEVTALMKKQ